jgi:3'(2'), 5'-bisphosphate nucleotidase
MKHNVDRLKRSVHRPIVLCSFLILALAALSGIGSRASLISSHLSWSKPFSSLFKMSYHKELQVAELAVQRATILTKKVFHEKVKGTVSKDDKSPVTVGDFGAQALIISAIRQNFPDDEIVGEEEANSLRENRNLSSQIWDLVREVKLDDEDADSLLGGPIKSEEDMLEAIDAGNSAGGAKGRIWALDPIDGTKGFLRGGQYAVCLALMVDGDVKVGVLGCPNLPVDDTERLAVGVGENQYDEEGKGVLFGAIIGQGASSRPLSPGSLQPKKEIHMNPLTDITQATFCESVEAAHSSHGDHAAIAEKLGITKSSVRMDSQAKYASIARGAGDLYLRLPVSKTYQESIWDHAAGDLIVREAGGTVTDALGKRLDFSKGRKLVANKGLVATPKDMHGPVLEAVMSVLGLKKE